MENEEKIDYLMDMVKQINQTTISLSQNQTLLLEQYKSLEKKYDSLDQKIDAKYSSLEEKMDTKYNSLEEKMDSKYTSLEEKMDVKYTSLEEKMDAKYTSLEEKMDSKYSSLEEKMDEQYRALNEKIDKYYEENHKQHFQMNNKLAHIQNDITDLRTDVDTLYALETDSRKKIERLV